MSNLHINDMQSLKSFVISQKVLNKLKGEERTTLPAPRILNLARLSRYMYVTIRLLQYWFDF